MNRGRLYIISGPSGSGKDAVMRGIFKARPEILFSISSITRSMRVGEVEGEKYNFISREKFEDMLSKDMFLEHNVYVGNYYGTPRKPVEDAINNGKDIFVEVDVNGAKQVKSKIKDAISIFILPPSLEVLKQRLSGRGTEDAEIVEKRISAATYEIECAKNYDYVVVNNILEDAVNDCLSIIDIDRLKTERNFDLINKLLNK